MSLLVDPLESYEDRGLPDFHFLLPDVLAEAAHRPHTRFLFRPHPLLWEELLSEGLWTPEAEHRFREHSADLGNVSLAASRGRRAIRSTPVTEQFEQAWAMVTDGVSFLAEFGYTGKPLLLTQAPGNPGWNSVGRRSPTRSSDPTASRAFGFLDRVERGIDPDAEKRRESSGGSSIALPEVRRPQLPSISPALNN